jgi:purine nucleosidase
MERIILDLDLSMGAPGTEIDDGFALALALADPGIALDLVTTVNGNTDVTTVTVLTRQLLDRLGVSVPLHRGAAHPIVRPPAVRGPHAEATGSWASSATPAAVAMVKHVAAHPGEVTLIAVGPLTNVALAMRLDPTFARGLRKLIVMGGVFNGQTNSADRPGEYNVWCDPEAARIVLDSGVPAWWVGLDVTMQARITREHVRRIAAIGTPFATFAAEYAEAWIDHVSAGAPDGWCAMHDPLTVMAVSRPDIFDWRLAHVEVETGDRFRGATLADYESHVSGRAPANAFVAVGVDAQVFLDSFTQLMQDMGRPDKKEMT